MGRIIVGRWGVGKTATLLLPNRRLSETLGAINRDWMRDWYIGESALDIAELRRSVASRAPSAAIHDFEIAWRIEISRRMVLLLGHLSEHYSSYQRSGPHWAYIRSLYAIEELRKSAWQRLAEILATLATSRVDRGRSLRRLSSMWTDMLKGPGIAHIQNCLRDIEGADVQPVVAIEPIDTPASALEAEQGLAQSIVTALLNVFVSDYQPSRDQLIRVYAALPWHRYNASEIRAPQKLDQYIRGLTWRKDQLIQFINRRIVWELRSAGVRTLDVDDANAWGHLFQAEFANDFYSPPVLESTLSYVLRHTQHRPRDLQQIARRAVERCADERNCASAKEVFLQAAGGRRIEAHHLKAVTQEHGEKDLDMMLAEVSRRYPWVHDAIDALRGVHMPIDEADLECRLEGIGGGAETAIEALREAGILGVQVVTQSDGRQLERLLPAENYIARQSVNGDIAHCWYFFGYNARERIKQITTSYRKLPDVDVGIVLHPSAYEKIKPTTFPQWPAGI